MSPFGGREGSGIGEGRRADECRRSGSGGGDPGRGEEASGAARGGGATRYRGAPDQAAGAPLSGERLGGSGGRASRQAAEQRHRRGSSLRKWMIADGLWRAKARREVRAHQSRPRRECLGDLVRIDGSPHAWFESQGPARLTHCSVRGCGSLADGYAPYLRDRRVHPRDSQQWPDRWAAPLVGFHASPISTARSRGTWDSRFALASHPSPFSKKSPLASVCRACTTNNRERTLVSRLFRDSPHVRRTSRKAWKTCATRRSLL